MQSEECWQCSGGHLGKSNQGAQEEKETRMAWCGSALKLQLQLQRGGTDCMCGVRAAVWHED
jgi:hypothetical protein